MKQQDAQRINGAINAAMAKNRALKAEVQLLSDQVLSMRRDMQQQQDQMQALAAKVFAGGATA